MNKFSGIMIAFIISVSLVTVARSQLVVLPPCAEPFTLHPLGLRCVCSQPYYHLAKSSAGNPICTDISTFNPNQISSLCVALPGEMAITFLRDPKTLTSECVKCTVDSCSACSQPNVCTACIEGFGLVGGVCKRCPFDC
jgi:hypothetical protein